MYNFQFFSVYRHISNPEHHRYRESFWNHVDWHVQTTYDDHEDDSDDDDHDADAGDDDDDDDDDVKGYLGYSYT